MDSVTARAASEIEASDSVSKLSPPRVDMFPVAVPGSPQVLPESHGI